MNAPTQITLTKPILIEGVLHTTIPIRPPTPRDMAIVKRTYFSKAGRGKALILRLTGDNEKLLLTLCGEDKDKINDYLEARLPE